MWRLGDALSLKWTLLLYMACLLAGFTIFLRGFLAVKTPLQGIATWDRFPKESGGDQAGAGCGHVGMEMGIDQRGCGNSEARPPLPAQFQRLVMVLMDALRADFVLPLEEVESLTHMEFVRRMITENRTLSFLAKAHPPTVTLPRIKALTTGDVPGFVDIILNFDSTELKEDNLISQFHRHGKKLVFYGDETWLKLFPKHFLRKEGITSFFVTDYTEVPVPECNVYLRGWRIWRWGIPQDIPISHEQLITMVDDNVTRHLAEELETTDWDVLILHYLGLDHIGHLAGPRSPLIQPKLTEMDGIIHRIYNKLIEQDRVTGSRSLLVLCGDHGMSDQGGHGGSSEQEVNTPLVMMSSIWDGGTGLPLFEAGVAQVDAVPTLALLFGLPIPQNSLGALLLPALSAVPVSHQMAALRVNTRQLLYVMAQNVADCKKEPSYKAARRAMEVHQAWLSAGAQADRADAVRTHYTRALHGMRERLTASLTTYDLHAMGAGILLLWVTCLSVLLNGLAGGKPLMAPGPGVLLMAGSVTAASLSLHLVLCTGPHASAHFCTRNPGVMTMVTIYFLLLCACLAQLCVNLSAFRLAKLLVVPGLCAPCWLLLAGTGGHTLSLLTSSLVEEEHQTWYLLTTSACLLLCVQAAVRAAPSSPAPRLSSYTAACSEEEQEEPDAYLQMQEMSSLHAQCFSLPHPVAQPSTMPPIPREAAQQTSPWEAPAESVNFPEETEVAGNQCRRKQEVAERVAALVSVLMAARVVRAWNQTGDKWAHLPDIGDWLVDPGHQGVLSGTVAAALCGLVALRWRRGGTSWMASNLLVAGCSGVYFFRASTGTLLLPGVYGETAEKGLLEARMVWSLVATMLVHAAVQYHRAADGETGTMHHAHNNSQPSRRTILLAHLQNVWTLVALLVLRPHNVPLVFLVSIMDTCLRRALWPPHVLPTWATALLFLWMGQAAFFFQGNSNSMSSVDVSAGYVGLSTYSPVLTALLLCASTYAGPMYWMLSLLRLLSERTDSEFLPRPRWRHVLEEVGMVWVGARALPLAAYTVLVTGQRYHLFVWTVFSPKLLYEGALTAVMASAVLLLQLLQHL